MKESEDEEEGIWYDFEYEKIPHFCFDCGRLVHAVEGCLPRVKSDMQWGEWLRATSGKSSSLKEGSHRPTHSANSHNSARSNDEFMDWRGDTGRRSTGYVRNIPTRRNMNGEFHGSADSRTGGGDKQEGEEVNSPSKDRHRPVEQRGRDLQDDLEMRRERNMRNDLKQR